MGRHFFVFFHSTFHPKHLTLNIQHLSLLKRTPFAFQNESFYHAKGVLLLFKTSPFASQKDSFCFKGFIAIFTKGACYILCGLNQRSQARSGKVKPNNYIGGCFKIEAARPEGAEAHRRLCQKSIIWVECNKCRRVGHPCPTHSAFIFSRLSGYSRDAIPSY